MTYTHLFWDFDGTLYNSYPQVTHALQSALEAAGLPVPPEGEALGFLKISVFEAVNHYAALYQANFRDLLELFRAEHEKEAFFSPYDGLRQCLIRLREAGATHYLYTHRDVKAWRNLEHDGLRECFADGVTAEDGFPLKPAPDALLALMARHSLAPGACAMIGDRDIDVRSGENAGMAGVLFDPDGFYAGLKCPIVAKSMAELQEKLLLS